MQVLDDTSLLLLAITNLAQLPSISTVGVGRSIYVKQIERNTNRPVTLTTTNSDSILHYNDIGTGRDRSFLSSSQCAKYISGSSNQWLQTGFYPGKAVFNANTLSLPDSFSSLRTIVTGEKSIYLINTSNVSHLLLLSSPRSFASDTKKGLFVTIKDNQGFSSINPILIRAGTALENPRFDDSINQIILSTNFASIELVANPALNQWHIVGLYSGNLVLRPL